MDVILDKDVSFEKKSKESVKESEDSFKSSSGLLEEIKEEEEGY